MHETAERLYTAARELKKVTGQSNVAGLLNQSPQTVKNWEERGVSYEGAVIAEAAIGCRAAWLKLNDGPMSAGSVNSTAAEQKAKNESVVEAAFPDDARVLARHFNEVHGPARTALFVKLLNTIDNARAIETAGSKVGSGLVRKS